jgi:hypothetical protein
MRPGLGEDVDEAGLPIVIDDTAGWNQRSQVRRRMQRKKRVTG